jgi:hypothetical protein
MTISELDPENTIIVLPEVGFTEVRSAQIGFFKPNAFQPGSLINHNYCPRNENDSSMTQLGYA